MIKSYKAVFKNGMGEIIEKKSKFISSVFPIETEEEALELIEKTKKSNWNANHNCTAYSVGLNPCILRYNDDGEPNGTAGKPILDIITGEDIHNVLIIVTRYFGGTLLGTGGLVRAYQKAAKEGLANSTIIEKQAAKKIKITTDYNGIGKIQYIVNENNLTNLNTEYTDIVIIYVLVNLDFIQAFSKKLSEATNGKAEIQELEMVYYSCLDGDVLLFQS